MGSDSIDPDRWRRPRPPLQRLCSFNWTNSAADWGGVWMLTSMFDMDTPKERWELTRVMSAKIDGVTGDTTMVWRGTYEGGGLRVWRSDLIDPAYKFKGEIAAADVAAMYRAAERAVVKMRKAVNKVFINEVQALLAVDRDYAADALIKECPDAETTKALIEMRCKYTKKKKAKKS